MSKTNPYPKMKCEQRKDSKICAVKIKKIKRLRQSGKSIVEISRIMDVASNTVWRKLNPEKAKKLDHDRYLLLKEKMSENPELKKKRNAKLSQYIQKRYNEDPKYRRYRLNQAMIYYEMTKQKRPERQ